MRSFVIIFLKALAVTALFLLGSAVSAWMNAPIALFGLSLIPAMYLFCRFESKSFPWLRASLFLALLGPIAWLSIFKLPQSIHPFIRGFVPVIILTILFRLFEKYLSAKDQSEQKPAK